MQNIDQPWDWEIEEEEEEFTDMDRSKIAAAQNARRVTWLDRLREQFPEEYDELAAIVRDYTVGAFCRGMPLNTLARQVLGEIPEPVRPTDSKAVLSAIKRLQAELSHEPKPNNQPTGKRPRQKPASNR